MVNTNTLGHIFQFVVQYCSHHSYNVKTDKKKTLQQTNLAKLIFFMLTFSKSVKCKALALYLEHQTVLSFSQNANLLKLLHILGKSDT